jgi:hypothetical protein
MGATSDHAPFAPRHRRGRERHGAGRGALMRAPGGHARKTHSVTLRFLRRLSTQNVTQLFEKVAHFVWCFGRARTTPIQKLPPAAISSHFNCILNLYTPNGVGEFV